MFLSHVSCENASERDIFFIYLFILVPKKLFSTLKIYTRGEKEEKSKRARDKNVIFFFFRWIQ